MIKYLYVDVETGGVDPERDALLQVAGMVVIQEGPMMEVVESFDLRMRPFIADREPSEEALKKTGFKREEIVTWEHPAVRQREFVDICERYVKRYNKEDKFWLVGYNVRFDDAFLRSWFDKCKDTWYGSLIRFPTLDTAVLAGTYLREVAHKMPRFRLENVAEELGIAPTGNLHDAKVDIELTYHIMRLILAQFPPRRET